MSRQAPTAPPLSQRQAMQFPYKHSTGPVVGRFLAALKEQKRIWGQRVAGLGVVVPPLGYSEIDASEGQEWVGVADSGIVTAVAKVRQPIEGLHPCSEPFAYVLIKLDGADTAMPHIVTESLDSLQVGTRVQAVWASDEERRGTWRDILHFRPVP